MTNVSASLDFSLFTIVGLFGFLASIITVGSFAFDVIKGKLVENSKHLFSMLFLLVISIIILIPALYFLHSLSIIKVSIFLIANIYLFGAGIFYMLSFLMILYEKIRIADFVFYCIFNITLVGLGFMYMLIIHKPFFFVATFLGTLTALSVFFATYKIVTNSKTLPEKFFKSVNMVIDKISEESSEENNTNKKILKGYKSNCFLFGYMFFQSNICICLYWYQFIFMKGAN